MTTMSWEPPLEACFVSQRAVNGRWSTALSLAMMSCRFAREWAQECQQPPHRLVPRVSTCPVGQRTPMLSLQRHCSLAVGAVWLFDAAPHVAVRVRITVLRGGRVPSLPVFSRHQPRQPHPMRARLVFSPPSLCSFTQHSHNLTATQVRA
ncbi:hypothetical protein IG631_08764 [Alternaria alternata]|nr:hypothetical protein IG631_08764 [Alternaria alternata]